MLRKTFSGNFSLFIEASKQSPKSICKILPLQKPHKQRKMRIYLSNKSICILVTKKKNLRITMQHKVTWVSITQTKKITYLKKSTTMRIKNKLKMKSSK